jgi:hypothetical protein
MKKLILLLFVVASFITKGYSQVPEKSNTIVITLADSNGVKEKILKVLADKDYTVSSGKTSPTIITAPKTLKNGARVYYNFQIKGAEIILTGKLPVAGQSTMSISYQGKKGTPVMNGWEEMDKIAKAFAAKVRYEIR